MGIIAILSSVLPVSVRGARGNNELSTLALFEQHIMYTFTINSIIDMNSVTPFEPTDTYGFCSF